MVANKHRIYLTKNHQLSGSEDCLTNVFLFNEGGQAVRSDWVSKNIEQNTIID